MNPTDLERFHKKGEAKNEYFFNSLQIFYGWIKEPTFIMEVMSKTGKKFELMVKDKKKISMVINIAHYYREQNIKNSGHLIQ